MGIGKHNPEDNNKETENTLSPLTLGDPEKAAYNDKPEFPISFTNRVTEKSACYNIQGILQKLWSTKIRLVPFLVIPIILVIIIAVVASRSGEMPTQLTYADCIDGWIDYRGKCNYFSTKLGTWKQSQEFCKLHDSSLAIIDSEEELKFLNILRHGENSWIGLSREVNVSNWVWTNGTPYRETIFKIESLETVSGVLEYAFLNHNGVKSDPGSELKKWICNKKLALHTVE